MSIPNFPEHCTDICWEQALSMLVGSIAMEELALSHILNAEGEKLQYVLGTLHEKQGTCASIEDILKINESIGQVLDKIGTNQILLKGKLEQALKAEPHVCRKTKTFFSAPGFCWNQGCALPWIPAGKKAPCEHPVTKIGIPGSGAFLVSYSFAFRPAAGAGSVVIALQQIKGMNRETVFVKEGCTGSWDGITYLSGCIVISAEDHDKASKEIEFVLQLPCCTSVKQATLTIAAL